MTVNTPTTPGHDRDERPHAERDVDRFALEEPRGEDGTQEMAHETTSVSGKATSCPARSAVLAGARDDQHAPVDVQDVDVVAVELAEDVRADDLIGRCRSTARPAAR